MGNDPINLTDPSGGISIPPCPGTGQLAIFFAKAGASVGNIFSTLSTISSIVSLGINVAKVGTEIYNNSVQSKIINTQLIGNMTIEVGTTGKDPLGDLNSNTLGDGPGPLPPIFWEEYWYPSIEAADYAYSNTFYANISGQVFTVPGYPNVKFLLFHYEAAAIQKVKNGNLAKNANKGLIIDSRIDDRHEVPYKSTMEGGSNALMYPVERMQNQLHGNELATFYKTNNLQHGDPFLVPLYEPTLKHIPVRQFKPGYKPEIKIYDGSPFEWLLPSPTGAGALIEQLIKRLAF
jgi:hypothetical protein